MNGRAVTFTTPKAEGAADAAKSVGGIVEGGAGGLLTIEEGRGLAAIRESQRKASELTEIEEGPTFLENQRNPENKPWA